MACLQVADSDSVKLELLSVLRVFKCAYNLPGDVFVVKPLLFLFL